jgi:hypothetical protein
VRCVPIHVCAAKRGAREFPSGLGTPNFADIADAGHTFAGDRKVIFNQAVLGSVDRHRRQASHGPSAVV